MKTTNPSILVLMSTYNGELYLPEQIESIMQQKDVNVSLLIRDDGSKDNTENIVKQFQGKYPNRIDFYRGKNLGPAKSYLDLIKTAKKYEYYAFADQDDYWEKEKLNRAISKIKDADNRNGKVYLSSLHLVDKDLNHISYSKIDKKITFEKEMIKNIATGCTMVFDYNLKESISKLDVDYITMHDSFVLRYAMLVGGFYYVDDKSFIKYRQHGNNVLGMKSGFLSVWKDRWNRFVGSEKLSSKSAKELLRLKIDAPEEYTNFLTYLSDYADNKKHKKILKKMDVFGKDDKTTQLLYRIKTQFNKV